MLEIQNQKVHLKGTSGNIISLYYTNEFPDGRYPHPSLSDKCSSAGIENRIDDAIGMAMLAILKVLDAIGVIQDTTSRNSGLLKLPYQAIRARDIALRIAQECGVTSENLFAEAVTRCSFSSRCRCEIAIQHLISERSNMVIG